MDYLKKHKAIDYGDAHGTIVRDGKTTIQIKFAFWSEGLGIGGKRGKVS